MSVALDLCSVTASRRPSIERGRMCTSRWRHRPGGLARRIREAREASDSQWRRERGVAEPAGDTTAGPHCPDSARSVPQTVPPDQVHRSKWHAINKPVLEQTASLRDIRGPHRCAACESHSACRSSRPGVTGLGERLERLNRAFPVSGLYASSGCNRQKCPHGDTFPPDEPGAQPGSRMHSHASSSPSFAPPSSKENDANRALVHAH